MTRLSQQGSSCWDFYMRLSSYWAFSVVASEIDKHGYEVNNLSTVDLKIERSIIQVSSRWKALFAGLSANDDADIRADDKDADVICQRQHIQVKRLASRDPA